MKQFSRFFSSPWTEHSWEKIELVARAVAAVDMKPPILASSKEQQATLKADYENRLTRFSMCDPESVSVTDRSDDILKGVCNGK